MNASRRSSATAQAATSGGTHKWVRRSVCVLLVMMLVGLGYTVWQTNRPQPPQASNDRKASNRDKPAVIYDVSLELQKILDFDLPEGEVNDRFVQFFDRVPFPSVYASDDLSKFRSNAVKGRYSISEALSIWLRNTGCTTEIKDNDRLYITCLTAAIPPTSRPAAQHK